MRRAVLSTALTGLLLLTACGGDDEESSSDANTEEDADNGSSDNGSSDDGGTIPDISVGNIPGVSGECEDLYSAYISVFAGIGVPGATVGDVGATIDALQGALPDDLDDDAAVFGEAISKYFSILAEYEGDATAAYTNPDVIAALEEISSDEVTEASDNINAYFEATCPAGS